MVNMALPTSVQTSSSKEHKGFWKSTTYLAKIALILQGAPEKMLTFSQLMYRLAPLFPEDTKSVEVNIRVCLSSNKCFVKIPLVPGALNSKKNYWKLDTLQITEKMVRRHFRGILEFFPELASKIQTQIQPSEERASVCSPEASCTAKVKREVKFSSPFSIESILRRDSPRVTNPRPSNDPRSTVPFRPEQQPGLFHGRVKRTFNWDTEELERSPEPSPLWPVRGSTQHGLCSPGNAKVIREKPPVPMNPTTGPSLSPHSSHTIYSPPSLFRSWM